MHKKLKDCNVVLLLDLHTLNEQYGIYNKLEPDLVNTRDMYDSRRTILLRNEFSKSFLEAPFIDVDGHSEFVPSPKTDEHDLAYLREYLLDDSPSGIEEVTPEGVDCSTSHYYMKIHKSESDPNSFFIEIILKRGFLTYLKEKPSERTKILLQDILGILYDNNITDRDIVGHYMGLSLKSKDTFNSNFNNFLGEINV